MLLTRRTFIAGALVAAALGQRRHAAAQQSPPTPPQSTTGAFVTIKTPLGILHGRRASDGIRSFLGVPFAQPPVGALRFRQPQPLKAWTGTRDALALAPEAMQAGNAPMSEDCLYLNIWAPDDAGPHR